MRITNARKNITLADYYMKGEKLEWCDSVSYLGVTINKHLSWSSHVASIAAKARRNLSFIRRNLYNCPQHIKERSYLAIIRPSIEYASCVWDPHVNTDIKRLEQIQRSAARYTLSKPYNRRDSQHQSVTQMLNQLKWESLEKRRKMSTVTMLYKMRNNLVEIPTPYHPELAPARSRRGTSVQLLAPRARLDCYKYSFIPRAVNLWNTLPEAAVTADSVESFKASLSQWKM